MPRLSSLFLLFTHEVQLRIRNHFIQIVGEVNHLMIRFLGTIRFLNRNQPPMERDQSLRSLSSTQRTIPPSTRALHRRPQPPQLILQTADQVPVITSCNSRHLLPRPQLLELSRQLLVPLPQLPHLVQPLDHSPIQLLHLDVQLINGLVDRRHLVNAMNTYGPSVGERSFKNLVIRFSSLHGREDSPREESGEERIKSKTL